MQMFKLLELLLYLIVNYTWYNFFLKQFVYGHGFNSTGIGTNFCIFYILLTTLVLTYYISSSRTTLVPVTQASVVYLLVMPTIL